MSPRTLLRAAVILSAALMSACGPSVCEKSEAAASGKTGSCTSALPGLGDSCKAALSSCGDADRKRLDTFVTCISALPTCAPLTEADWQVSRDGCYAPLTELSAGCRDGLFASGLPGSSDGGVQPSAPHSPDVDGGGALDLVAVADGSSIALAWTAHQEGAVAGWEIHAVDGSGASVPLETTDGSGPMSHLVTGLSAGTARSYWVVGVDAQGNVAHGHPPAAAAADAGTGCRGPSDCPVNQVCDLGSCRALPCQGTGQGDCPAGYACEGSTSTCVRNGELDGGLPVATDAGTQQAEGPRPLVSERRSATTGDGGFATELTVSDYAADQDPALAVLDSAQQVMVVEQSGQLFTHATQDRGAHWEVAALDGIGQHAHLAWNRGANVLYACYQVGGTVRVRRSTSGGRTWDEGAATISYEATTDGGVAPVVGGCDIAPWTGSSAVVVTTEQEGLFLRTVGKDLALGAREPVYANESATGGVSTVFNAEHPAVATDAQRGAIHVVFTGSRNLLAGGTDKDVYAVYRDPARAGTGFSPRKRLTLGAIGSQGQNLLQDRARVAVEPGTGRAVAVFQSEEPSVGGASAYKSIYVALFGLNPALPDWATGSDLSVFVRDNVGNYLVMPERPAVGAAWDAVNPGVAILPGGRATVTFAAGAQGQAAGVYAVGVSFDAISQVGTAAGKGWFLPPAHKVSGVPVVDFANTPKGAGPVTAADGQLSTYVGYIEGVGGGATLPNRLLMVPRP